jgi:ketosteroid isomerase-like protein
VTEHPNIEQARRGYAAFGSGDLATLSELIADDVVWHAQGVGSLSGDYRGRDQVFGFFGRLAEETGGTFRLDVHDILANDEHTAVLATLTASRGGKSIEVPVVNVSHNDANGKITEFWTSTTDPQAALDFWA